MSEDWTELFGDDVPYHLRLDTAPLGCCNRCGRQTWSESEVGTEDRMTQPDGNPCGGRLVAGSGARLKPREEDMNEEPIPMSEFTLGERYSSEDMYRDYPYLKPGDRVAVEIGGVLYTDTIKAASPVVYPTLTPWQRLVRRLTPPRWRKPLKPIRRDPLQRAQALTAKTLAAVEQLTAPPAKSWWRRWVEWVEGKP